MFRLIWPLGSAGIGKGLCPDKIYQKTKLKTCSLPAPFSPPPPMGKGTFGVQDSLMIIISQFPALQILYP